MDITQFPTVADFRRFGRFHSNNLALTQSISEDLLIYIIPNYFFIKEHVSKQFIKNYKKYCMALKRQAMFEDYIKDLNDQKELLIRRLESKNLCECNNTCAYAYNPTINLE
jgi:hypothetical protein